MTVYKSISKSIIPTIYSPTKTPVAAINPQDGTLNVTSAGVLVESDGDQVTSTP